MTYSGWWIGYRYWPALFRKKSEYFIQENYLLKLDREIFKDHSHQEFKGSGKNYHTYIRKGTNIKAQKFKPSFFQHRTSFISKMLSDWPQLLFTTDISLRRFFHPVVVWRTTLINWGANTKGHQNNYITDQKKHNYYQFLQQSSPQIPDQQDHVWTEGKVGKRS